MGILFASLGLLKIIQPVEKLAVLIKWISRFPESSVKFIAFTELLGGAGLLIPLATGILPTLAITVAFGLATMMLLAVFHHVEYNEKRAVSINLLLLAMAVFVVCGRLLTLVLS